MSRIDMRIDAGFVDHPKTKRLIRIAGFEAFYCLMKLFSVTSTIYPKGILKGCDEIDIEVLACWTGEKGKFFNTIIDPKVGFIEKIHGEYCIHDWEEHQHWLYYSEERSNIARQNIQKRWNKKYERYTNGIPTELQNSTNGNSINGNTPLPSPSPSPSPSPLPNPYHKEEACPELSSEISGTPFIDLPMVGSVSSPLKTFTVTEEMIEEYQEVYTNVDVKAELKKMKLWLDANPTKRKKNVKAFIARWLAKAQDRPKPARKLTYEEILAEEKQRLGEE